MNLGLGHGETLGLVGESGCGKTFAALAILGLLPSGATHLDPSSSNKRSWWVKPAAGAPAVAKAWPVFQEPMSALNPVRTLGAMLQEALRLHGSEAAHTRQEAMDRLDEVGIPEPRQRLGYYPHQLSGGIRQRALLALAPDR